MSEKITTERACKMVNASVFGMPSEEASRLCGWIVEQSTQLKGFRAEVERLEKIVERLEGVTSGQEAALNRMCIVLSDNDAWTPNANLERSVSDILKDRDRYKAENEKLRAVVDAVRVYKIALHERGVKQTATSLAVLGRAKHALFNQLAHLDNKPEGE